MSVREILSPTVGRWTGETRLWLDPTEEPKPSRSSLEVSMAARDHVIRVDYDWSYEGAPQVGTLLLGFDRQTGTVTAAFADSFHMSEALMLCEGTLGQDGRSLSVKGSYGDGQGGPPWGWRISVETPSPDELVLTMHNITPGGEEALAVRGAYARA